MQLTTGSIGRTPFAAHAWFVGLVVLPVDAACHPLPDADATQEARRIQVPLPAPANSVVAVDLERDGSPDLVVTAGDSIHVLYGRGDGSFTLGQSLAAGENASDVTVGDVDQDDFLDLVVANHETDYVTLLFGTADGRFERRPASTHRVSVTPHPHAVLLKDVDRDGRLDLLVDDRGAESVRVFPGVDGGVSGTGVAVPVGGDPYRGFMVADVDQDGYEDLVAPIEAHVAVVRGLQSGGFSTDPLLLEPGFPPFSVAAADFDGDGRPDIAAGSGERVGSVALWLNRASGGFERSPDHVYVVAPGPTTVAAFDMAGDSRARVIVASYVGNGVAVIDSDAGTVDRIPMEGNPYGVAHGDLDGDGRSDFVVTHDTEPYLTVFLSSG